MAETYRFFNDPLYTANDMNNVLYNVIKKIDGIIVSTNNDNNDLLHSAAASYQSTIKAGVAFKLGTFYENTSDKTLNHDAVTTTYKRIDRIVVRLDSTGKTVLLTVIKGVETTGTPAAPSITTATDIMVSQLLIDNTTGTPVYTITDERELIFNDSTKRFYTTADLTLPAVYGDIQIYVNSGSARTVDISAGAVCNNSGSGAIKSLFPQAFVKNIGAGTCTLRIKTGGTGTGYDITLLQTEWALLHWDGTNWYIIADEFTTEKIFVYATPGSGTHTVPAGRGRYKAICTGGGASGARLAASAGEGGGAGGTGIGYSNTIPAASIAYTVGAGGAARGTDGINSGGFSSAVGVQGNGATTQLGGGVSGGTIQIIGGDGTSKALTATTPTYRGGDGGASYWGGGGYGGSTTGANGRAYGAGGGGSAGANNSGAGCDGVVIFFYGDQ